MKKLISDFRIGHFALTIGSARALTNKNQKVLIIQITISRVDNQLKLSTFY